ncbi:MAG TPA: vanadium-dependent haloperoxidase [Candidatus Limnocylindria bacterium]
MPEHRSLAGQLTDMPGMPAAGHNDAYAWPVVANAALAEIMRRLFPTAPAERLVGVDRLEASLAATAPRGIRERSVERGRSVASAVFAWSTTDGGHEGYVRNVQPDYQPPTGEGLWVPTPPAFLPPLQPSWGRNRTFVPTAACDPGSPPAYSTDPDSACFVEALEVYDAVNRLTAEQLAIARFWADDPGATATPAGHSLAILVAALRNPVADLATAAAAMARVGIAVSDAFVACWRAKYTHNLLRPITYVRQTIDATWGDPLPVTTPPFPEYTSGHSAQSAAAATVLTAQFGALAFVDRTHEARGLPPRGFDSFDAAAAEAAISRLYGGIHFRSAIERGLDQGRCIGQRVLELTLL